MSFHFERIVLGESVKRYSIVNADDARVLAPLSKVNVFVGANNAGKSRFVRELADFQKFVGVPPMNLSTPKNQIVEAKEIFKSFVQGVLSQAINNFRISDVENLLKSFDKVHKQADDSLWVTAAYAVLTRAHQLQRVAEVKELSGRSEEDKKNIEARILQDVKSLAQRERNRLAATLRQYDSIPQPKAIYFPVLRTLRPIQQGADALQQRTREDYFQQAKHVEIFTGQSLYDEIQQLLLGNLAERETVSEFQNFISEQFFESQPLALIPKLKTKTLEVKIGNEMELPIHKLGDGIQSILTLTFPLFKRREEPLLVFYEEPEMFMHPGIQRVFLNTLMTFANHQFFLTTHSNHFLDITLDVGGVSVFTFRKRFDDSSHKEKEATFEIENVSSGNVSCLELLGVRNSSVFLSNCTIWVEGITDRRYLAHYLKLHVKHLRESGDATAKEFKEDLHYSFVEYGGANVTHWSFLDNIPDAINVDRLCARLFLLADKDSFAAGAKAERQEKLKKTLGDRFHLLGCKEIENLLCVRTLREVVTSYEKEKPQFKEVERKDYANKPLGTFIKNEFFVSSRTRKGSYEADSGTVTDKVNFCDRAIAAITSHDDLCEEAKEIAKKLYDFIAANNR